ncbi:flagellar protein MotY [Pokkaliibacter sp. CJK22405]|uniref:flagellar protein MotY n=1 Tax=Pokkaliibacter sp. CJK22405 TaxID=3384615 RepID=UPI00398510F1
MKTLTNNPAMWAKRSCLLLGLAFFASQSHAVTFSAGLENTAWNLEASPFTCKLSQTIPAFGTATFEREAGESVLFYLEASQRELLSGQAVLQAESPAWLPGFSNTRIGLVNLDEGKKRVKVDSKEASIMLASLHQGKFPTFNARSFSQSQDSLRVQVSSVNFQDAYNRYQTCIAGLLPVNFRQIARTAILFNSDGTDMSDDAKDRLDMIARYISVDKSVLSIYVDGHADAQGRRLLNRDLSKKRAQAVSDYLVKKGIPESMVITRFHGERYPVVDNKTADHRARNRRVTIRLDREANSSNGEFPEEDATQTQ